MVKNYNNIPARFKGVAAAFDEMAARLCSYESSGSEHSPDLSDLVNSFFESQIRDRKIEVDGLDHVDDEVIDETEIDSPDQIELRKSLSKLLIDRGNDSFRSSIRAAVEAALGDISGDFKRRLMTELRARGFDAGLCKSKWEKKGSSTPEKYEYIDVNAGEDRYIVEVNLARQFEIARPTASYTALLENFPRIFVGKSEELKQVIKLMSRAIRKSLKRADLIVAPWRRLGHMQNKWFGSYRRTANEAPREKAVESLAGNRRMGFVPVMGSAASFYCRGDFPAKNAGMISGLAAALK